MDNLIIGVTITPLKRIKHEKGDIYHAMKSSDASFNGFGEAYFSFINKGDIKGWKKHNQMLLNLIVPIGAIRFVIFDDRENSPTKGGHQEFIIGPENDYARLTVAPGLWVAFQGISNTNCLLNIASLEHDPNEAVNIPLTQINYDW